MPSNQDCSAGTQTTEFKILLDKYRQLVGKYTQLVLELHPQQPEMVAMRIKELGTSMHPEYPPKELTTNKEVEATITKVQPVVVATQDSVATEEDSLTPQDTLSAEHDVEESPDDEVNENTVTETKHQTPDLHQDTLFAEYDLDRSADDAAKELQMRGKPGKESEEREKQCCYSYTCQGYGHMSRQCPQSPVFGRLPSPYQSRSRSPRQTPRHNQSRSPSPHGGSHQQTSGYQLRTPPPPRLQDRHGTRQTPQNNCGQSMMQHHNQSMLQHQDQSRMQQGSTPEYSQGASVSHQTVANVNVQSADTCAG